MLIVTLAYLLSLGGLPIHEFAEVQIYPYFFIMLLLVELPATNLLAVIIFVIAGYILLFIGLGKGFNPEMQPIDTANGFFSMMAPLLLVLSLIITLIEEALSIPILGQQSLVTAGYSSFVNLIYAPFVEELGFRILPLGILTFIPFIMHVRQPSGIPGTGKKYLVSPVKAFFVYLAAPGYYRSRYGGRNRGVDLVLIILTSAIFAYAHIYYGAWSWGKLLPIFVDGLILAVGYLKFGIYVDIPLHWFINDFAGLELVDPGTLALLVFVLIWCLAASVLGMIYSVRGIRRFFGWKKNKNAFR